eukprot:7346053-Ditylum_brightwellii.AAC.1
MIPLDSSPLSVNWTMALERLCCGSSDMLLMLDPQCVFQERNNCFIINKGNWFCLVAVNLLAFPPSEANAK